VQLAKRMAYLLKVLENLLAAPPEGPMQAGDHAQQRRGSHLTAPASSDRQGISRYIGGSYGVCPACLSSPCELDCLTLHGKNAPPTEAPLPPLQGVVPFMALGMG